MFFLIGENIIEVGLFDLLVTNSSKIYVIN